MFSIETALGRLAVLVVAVAVLIVSLLWARRAASPSFFLGMLVGTGLVLSFDIVWVHWIFGLHHVTNHQEDLVLEPLLIVTGLAFIWFGISRERRRVR